MEPRQAPDQGTTTLTYFIEDHRGLLTALSVFIALTTVVNNLSATSMLKSIISLLLAMISITIAAELLASFYRSPGKTVRLYTFGILTVIVMISLCVYWLLLFRWIWNPFSKYLLLDSIAVLALLKMIQNIMHILHKRYNISLSKLFQYNNIDIMKSIIYFMIAVIFIIWSLYSFQFVENWVDVAEQLLVGTSIHSPTPPPTGP